MDPEQFIDWLVPAAQPTCRSYQLPVSVCVAQAAIESGWGKYCIGKYNLFGRKYNGSGAYIEKVTDEYIDGEWLTITAKFQDYASLEEAVEDWCILLTQEPVYEGCLAYRDHAEQFIQALAPIYATDPDYEDKVLATIHANDLTQFDC
ncbi:glucosaminidase domain-containing protein [Anaerospora sp.]|uniref:glycoside hydrolase family 73 protein n=1 Tax=Anaerospora sp. TaxID=1960278 RepID=UPI00289BE4FC|nr:glucosaminidase domain-containing protein [Anaerospora sp.]